MAQITLGYRHSPLSENDGHPGALRAGDRMPDLPVQQWIDGAWGQTHLHRALEPSHPTLVLALPDGGPRPEDLARADGPVVQLASARDDAGRFVAAFGDKGSAVLVRPDGYAGWIGPLAGAAERVQAYRDRWFAQSHSVRAR